MLLKRVGLATIESHAPEAEGDFSDKFEDLKKRRPGRARFIDGLAQGYRDSWAKSIALDNELPEERRRHRIELDTLRQAGWGVAQPFTTETLQSLLLGVTPPGWRPQVPGGLFNAMIAPLTPFGIRGFLWYQGEGNAGRPGPYHQLLPALIRGWREAWDLGDLPFLVVQLPNYRAVQEEPSDSDWARLREAQLHTVEEVPATGLAVTIDLGEADDVHPPYKREVGRRAARWALGTTPPRPFARTSGSASDC